MTEHAPPWGPQVGNTAFKLVAGATALGLFFGSRTYFLYAVYPDNRLTWAQALLPALVDWYLWAVFAPAIVWLAWRHPVARDRWVRPLALHAAVGVVVVLAKVGLDVALGRPLAGLEPMGFARVLRMSFHPNLITYFVLVGFAHAVLYYRAFRDREVRASRLETRLARAELDVLKARLHPHFLFNTLHAIGTLMHRDVDAAERMLSRLGELLRVTIERAGAHEVPLREELAFLERYLEIERARFADRLTVEMAIDPEALDVPVPHLVLQPIVENAVRHGIGPRAGRGTVGIAASRHDDWLHLEVRDDGRGLGTTVDEGSGTGIPNTRARLEQMYGTRHRFRVEPAAGGGVVATIELPVHGPRDTPR